MNRQPTTRVRRDGPGYYTVRDTRLPAEDAEVRIIYNPELAGAFKWIARAGWDRYCVTDPLPTQREAIEQAEMMLGDLTGQEA